MNKTLIVKCFTTLLTGACLFSISFVSVKILIEERLDPSQETDLSIPSETVLSVDSKKVSMAANNLSEDPVKVRGDINGEIKKTNAEKSLIKKTLVKKKYEIEVTKIGLALQKKKEMIKQKSISAKRVFTSEKVKKLPETLLDISLLSSFIAPANEKNIATIAGKKMQYRYKINQLLKNEDQVKVVAINRDSIILNNKGKLEKLLMYPTNKTPDYSNIQIEEQSQAQIEKQPKPVFAESPDLLIDYDEEDEENEQINFKHLEHLPASS